MQFYLSAAASCYEEESGFSEKKWYCIGKVVDDPLFLRRDTGEVWYFPDTGVPWQDSDRFEVAARTLSEFVEQFLFGPRYATLCPRDEAWLSVLREVGLIS